MAELWLSEEMASSMKMLAADKFPLETGGMLLGYTADNQEVVLTHLIGPGPNARHNRYSFEPDADYQQLQLERLYHTYEGQFSYLGDWNTHPSGVAVLNTTDKQTLEKIAKTPSSQNNHPIMAILAGGPYPWYSNVQT